MSIKSEYTQSLFTDINVETELNKLIQTKQLIQRNRQRLNQSKRPPFEIFNKLKQTVHWLYFVAAFFILFHCRLVLSKLA